MKTRFLICLAVLALASAAAPAWARPCCTECETWPALNPEIDWCARWCDLGCFAGPMGPTETADGRGTLDPDGGAAAFSAVDAQSQPAVAVPAPSLPPVPVSGPVCLP
jgi:hypothetical protein